MAGFHYKFGKNLGRCGYCRICRSLDYYPIVEVNAFSYEAVKKPPYEVKNSFPLSKVHPGLLDSILVKMNYTSFTRLRRSCKNFSEYIQYNRTHIRLALFHDMNLYFSTCKCQLTKKYVPYVNFRSQYCLLNFIDFFPGPQSIADRDEKEKLRLESHSYFNDSGVTQICKYGKYVFEVPRENPVKYQQFQDLPSIRICLKDLGDKPEILKELVGIYKPEIVYAYFENVLNPMPLPKIGEICQNFLSFINGIRLTEVLYDGRCGKNPCLERVCPVLNPKILYIAHQLPPEFIRSLQKTTTLRMRFFDLRIMNPEDFFKFEVLLLEYHSFATSTFLLALIQAWIDGKSRLQEMYALVDGEIAMDIATAQRINPDESWKYLEKYMDNEETEKYEKIESFVIEQKNSGKQAVVALMLRGNKYNLYFKEIEPEFRR